jgi:PAS domain S-box-containing protein
MTPEKLTPRAFVLEQLALFKKPGLSRRVLLYILLCSSFFTLLSTGVQLYTDFQRDRSDIDHHIDFIRDSYLEPLAVHAYNMDYDQMTLLLAGIFNLNDIVYLEVSEPLDDGRQSLATLGTLPEKRTICKEFTLAYPSNPGEGPQHAFLLVAASLNSVYQRLWDKTLVILAANAVKTFVAALCIFVIIQYVITRHLVRLAAYTKGLHMDRPAPPLNLRDGPGLSGSGDELDQLAGAITDLWNRTVRTGNSLKKSQAHYRLLADNVIDVIWTMDMDQCFTYVSPSVEPLTGFTPEEFMVAPLQDRFTPASFEKAITVYRQGTSLEKKMGKGSVQKNRTLQLEIIRKDGTTVWTETRASFLRESDGSLAGIIGVTRDISRRRQAETRLQQAQKLEAIGSLAGGIAHDFNNILSAIIGYAQLAMDRVPKDSPVQADLAQVYKAGERAKGLVMQILSFSRQQEQNAAPVQIRPIIKEVLKFLKSTLPASIGIRQALVTGQEKILADPTRIHQVLMNLCTNAAHAMDNTGGTLTVGLDTVTLDPDDVAGHPDLKPGRFLKLTVNDTGHGIEPDILPKIFDPYFTTKEKDKGTGLGLATVHGIIRSYGGVVTVYSEPGRGATFHVYFPVIDDPAGSDPVPAGTGYGDDAAVRGNAAILFVDDEPAIANLGKQLLRHLGYRVTSLTDPVAALALFKDHPDRFDLVITDLTMPGMKGDRLAGELIKIRPDIRVILCSGFSVQLSEDEAEAAGIKAFVEKPFLKQDLAAVIQQVLGDKNA